MPIKSGMVVFLPHERPSFIGTNQNIAVLANTKRIIQMDHKCDMFCLWEDLDYSYEKCVSCVNNSTRTNGFSTDNQADTGLPENKHLWKNNSDLTFDQYKKYLKNLLKE